MKFRTCLFWFSTWIVASMHSHSKVHVLPSGASAANDGSLTAELQMILHKARPGDVINVPSGLSIKAAILASFSLELRGARNKSASASPCLTNSGQSEAVIEMNAEPDQIVTVDSLSLLHNSSSARDFGSEDSKIAGDKPHEEEDSNATMELSGTCCVGVDGGTLNVSSCCVVAINGTCIGATGNTSKLQVRSCEFHTSSAGIVGYNGAHILCESTTMSNLAEAGLLVVGNNTLAELDSCDISDCRAFGAAGTGGGSIVARGNRIARSGRAGITVSGVGGWARVLGNQLDDNGDYGVSADGGSTARVESNRIAGHQYGVAALEGGTRMWLQENDFSRSAVRDVASAAGGVVEWGGGHLESRCVTNLPDPGPNGIMIPTTRLRPSDPSSI